MKTNPFAPLGLNVECRRRRLVETSIAAVDVCDCGMMHLHVGAFTLRLAPNALRELAMTLERSLLEQALPTSPETPFALTPGKPRGEA